MMRFPSQDQSAGQGVSPATETQQKWDQRYAELEPDQRREPLPFVQRCLARLPRQGRALDVAAGAGRHSLLLARHGLRVDAVDISWQGLRLARQRALAEGFESDRIQFIVGDLERPWLPRGSYRLVLVTFFLSRPLLSRLKQIIQPGGWLVYETFTIEEAERSKSDRRDFFLAPGELQTTFADFEIQTYDEGEHRGRATAQLLARKPIEG